MGTVNCRSDFYTTWKKIHSHNGITLSSSSSSLLLSLFSWASVNLSLFTITWVQLTRSFWKFHTYFSRDMVEDPFNFGGFYPNPFRNSGLKGKTGFIIRIHKKVYCWSDISDSDVNMFFLKFCLEKYPSFFNQISDILYVFFQ